MEGPDGGIQQRQAPFAPDEKSILNVSIAVEGVALSGPTGPKKDDVMNLPPSIVTEGDERLGLTTQVRGETSLAHVVATDQLGFWFRR